MEEGERPKVLIAGKRTSVGTMRKVVEKEGERKEGEARVEISPESLEALDRAAQGMAGGVARAMEIQSRMTMGDYRLPLPPEQEPQREYVRRLLDGIEKSNRDTHDFAISSLVKGLEASLDDMDPEVAGEVRARLAVHDCAELIKQADGWIARKVEEVGPGHTIGSAASEANKRGHALSRGTIKTLLREGLPGLRIGEAWDLLQDANYKYTKMVEEVNKIRTRKGEKLFEVKDFVLIDDEIESGKVPMSFFSDSNGVRREAVRQLLIEKLGGERKARKSLHLAEQLSIATLETSVFNRTSMTGNDQLAEIIGLKGWRAGRAVTGRMRGPKIHEGAISGFGKSWLRENRIGEDNVNKQLYVRDINIDEIAKGNWVYFSTVFITRYQLLKGLLLDRKPKPLSIDKTLLQTAVVYFNTADKPSGVKKCGPLKLRTWWLAGVVDMALADFTLEWSAEAFSELRKAATVEELSPEKKAGTFITPEQWQWIERATNLQARMRRLMTRRALMGVTKKITSS